MNTMAMLVRREFWEHRSLWIAPLVWVSLITILFAWLIFVQLDHFGNGTTASTTEIEMDGSGVTVDRKEADAPPAEAEPKEDEHDGEGAADAGAAEKHDQDYVTIGHLAIYGLVSTFTIIVVFFYLIDCLFAERRDRSILFWKSLPISEPQVVLSKLVVALIAVPVGVLLLSAATQIVLSALVWMKVQGSFVAEYMPDWNVSSWLRSQVVAFALMLGGILWYAPIAAWFLLLSAWARRLVFLWAIVPLIAIPALEGFFFHSANFLRFLAYRFSGHTKLLNVDPNVFNTGTDSSLHKAPRVADVYSSLDMTGLFTSLDMWIGLAVAAAMVYATIRIRRYRDDA